MSTQFHNEPDEDLRTFFHKDPGPTRHSALSRSRRWLIPAFILTLTLVLILAFGINSGRLSSQLGSLEDTMSNLSLSLSSAHQDVQRLQSSAASAKDQLSSVAESVKQLAAVETLSDAVASLKCALELLIHNRTHGGGCCPLGWENFESSCFFFSKATLSWHEARDWCRAHQSQLLMLTSDTVWDFVRSHTGSSFHWVGLTDESGKWEWVNGTPYILDRGKWMPGQPDNWDGRGDATEDCAHLHWDARLNDQLCSERLRYICQAQATQI